MKNIVEYIKNILDDDSINVKIKDDKYIITKVYDAKNLNTLDTLFGVLKLRDKIKIESKLKLYLPETTFRFYVEIINQPKPTIDLRNQYNYYKSLYGGVDMVNGSDSYVTIHRGPSFNNLGVTIPDVDTWYSGCYVM